MSEHTFDLSEWMQARQILVEQHLEVILQSHVTHGALLGEAMRYSVLDGGKRVRPLLLFATAELFGVEAKAILAPACALELIHCYSLVHDDLPAMDNDDLRRGRLSCHKQFDEATAILVGDSLQTLAFEQLSEANLPIETTLALIQSLASASSAMVLGQALDIENVNGVTVSLSDLQEIHRHKTGALITAAMVMGAQCAQVNSQTQIQIKQSADVLGLVFQIQDDILDVTADTQTLGKPSGSDEGEGKTTYVSLLGLAQAQQQAETQLETVITAISQLDGNTESLLALAHFIVHRER